MTETSSNAQNEMEQKIEIKNELVTKTDDETADAKASRKEIKRKKLTSIEWIAASNETINEIDAIEADYSFVQRANKRQKIEIELIPTEEEDKENCPRLRKCDGQSSKGAVPRCVKPTIDGKTSTETGKLRTKYEQIHAVTVQKLNAHAEQLRMEISTLRTALANEQNAVRTLR